jgi:hypothetical protein
MKYFLLTLIFSINVFASYIIPDGAVTTAKIASGAVTPAKKAALGQQISASSGSFSSSSTSVIDVTNLSVTITTTGRPVFIGLIQDGGGSSAYLLTKRDSEATAATLFILRGATTISDQQLKVDNNLSGGYSYLQIPSSSLFTIDTPTSGTYTYKVRGRVDISGSTPLFGVYNSKLIAYEL